MTRISPQAIRIWAARLNGRIDKPIRRLVHGAVDIRSKGPRGLASSTAQVETSSHAHKPFYHEEESLGDGVVIDAGPQRM